MNLLIGKVIGHGGHTHGAPMGRTNGDIGQGYHGAGFRIPNPVVTTRWFAKTANTGWSHK